MPDCAMSLVPVTADDKPLLSAWLDGDADGMSHLGFYRDAQGWLGRLSEHRWGWIAHSRRRPVGFLDLEADGSSGSFSYYVAPTFRGTGCGTALLLSTVAQCVELGLERAVGFVDPHNRASLAALRRAGFTVDSEPDGDGMLLAVRDLTGS